MTGEPHVEGVLGELVERKRRENRRRNKRNQRLHSDVAPVSPEVFASQRDRVVGALRRRSDSGSPLPQIVAEVKFRSPSAGTLALREPGMAVKIARRYETAGVAAVSVLADRVGFGGTPLDVRRVSDAVEVPVLFKEFVLEESQVTLARACGASMVLLLVRVLSQSTLQRLTDCVQAQGMEPVVEAADAGELDRALATGARVIGVNARDLRTFHVNVKRAKECIARTPSDRIAVFMSGVHTVDDYQRVADGRADAVLIGETLMRSSDPECLLSEFLPPRPRTDVLQRGAE